MSSNLTFASCSSSISVWSFGASSPSPQRSSSFSPHSGAVQQFQWNHNQTVLISVGDDGKIGLNFASGAPLYSLQEDFPLSCLALTSGSRYVAVGGSAARLSVWDLKKNEIARSLEGVTESLSCMEIQSIGGGSAASLASGSLAGTIRLHNLESGQLRNIMNIPNQNNIANLSSSQSVSSPLIVTGLNFSPHRPSQLCAGDSRGRVHLFDLNSSRHLFAFGRVHSAAVQGVKFSPNQPGVVFSAGLDEKVFLHDLNAKGDRKAFAIGEPVTAFDLNEDGNFMICGSISGALTLFDLRMEKPIARVSDAHSHEVGVNAVKFAAAVDKKKQAKQPETRSAAVVPSNSAPSESAEFFSPIRSFLPDSSLSGEAGLLSPENFKTLAFDEATPAKQTKQKTENPTTTTTTNTTIQTTQIAQQNNKNSTEIISQPQLIPPQTSPARPPPPVKDNLAVVPNNSSAASKSLPQPSLALTSPPRAPLALPEPAPSRPAASPSPPSSNSPDPSLAALRSELLQEFSTLRSSLHREFSHLQIEILRQFHDFSSENHHRMENFIEEQRKILEEIKQIRKEWKEKRNIY